MNKYISPINIDIPTNIKINKIYHISDIHINLYKKHEEYKEVFENLYIFLTNEISSNNFKLYEAILVVTGDILHSKNELSPEAIEITNNLFTKLSTILPVFIIAGNHDANLSNKNRLDSLSPIIEKLHNNPTIPFHYLKNTGVYRINNILFGLTSVFDYFFLKASSIQNIEGCIKIALFHGRVNGAETDMGMILNGENNNNKDVNNPHEYSENNQNNNDKNNQNAQNENNYLNTITPRSFKGYDYVLLGDIHKHQYLNKKKTIAYAGSLIQQNHGESICGHGVLVWDLQTGNSKLYEIPNNYGYYTIKIIDNSYLNCFRNIDYKSIDITKHKHDSLCNIPKNVRLRIEYYNLNYNQLENIVSLIKLNHNVIEIQFKPINSDNLDINGVNNNMNNNINKISFNLKDINCQNNLIDKFFNNKNNDDTKINPDNLSKIKELNIVLNKDITNNNTDYLNWELYKLEFDNLFSYDSGNIINFNGCKGIVGIIAPNHTGKSAIIDIILFCLFNKFSRKGDIKDIINIKSKNFRVYLIFKICDKLYHIEKKGQYSNTKSKRTSELPVSVDFYQTDLKYLNYVSLKEKTPKDTMNKILEYVGSYDDIILTNVSLQGNNTNFIDITDTPRKNEMEKLLNINIFTDLKEKASKIINDKKTIFKYLKTFNIIDDITTKLNELTLKKQTYNSIKILLNDLNSKYEDSVFKITKLKKKIIKIENQSNCELWNDIINTFSSNNIGFQFTNFDLYKINLDLPDIIILYNSFNEFASNIININKLDWSNLQIELSNLKQILTTIHTHITKQYLLLNSKINLLPNNPDNFNNLNNSDISKLNFKITEIKNEIYNLKNTLIPVNINDMDTLKKNIKTCKNDKIKSEDDYNNIILKENKIKNNIKTEIIRYQEYNTELINIQTIINKTHKNILLDKINNINISLKNNINNVLNKKLYNNLNNQIINIIDYINNNTNFNMDTKFNNKNNNKSNIDSSDSELNDINEYENENNNKSNIDSSDSELTDINEYENENECNSSNNNKIKKLQNMIKKSEKNKLKYENNYNKIIEEKHNKKEILNNINWKIENYMINIDSVKKNKKITDKITKLEENLVYYKNVLNLNSLIDIYNNSKISINKLLNNINIFIDKIKNQECDYIKYKLILSTLKIEEDNYNKIILDRDKAKEAYFLLKSELKSIAAEITELNNKKEEIKELENEINIYQNYIEIVKNIPYMLIENIKPKLEQIINEMLSVLVDFTIYFDIKDNKQISIYLKRESEKNKREILLSNASGFEKFIGGLFIRIALINISNLPKPNFLVIDEGWGCFDNNNINNIGLIFDYLKNKFDFILTISHIQELREHLNEHIILKTNKGLSHVNFI